MFLMLPNERIYYPHFFMAIGSRKQPICKGIRHFLSQKNIFTSKPAGKSWNELETLSTLVRVHVGLLRPVVDGTDLTYIDSAWEDLDLNASTDVEWQCLSNCPSRECELPTGCGALQQANMHCNENPIYIFTGKELRGLSPNFHVHVCEWFIYSQDRSTYFPAAECTDRLWKYINRSQTHEYGSLDRGRAIPFLGIFV
jgi:hypothetical protein